jgi:hypothetical protein
MNELAKAFAEGATHKLGEIAAVLIVAVLIRYGLKFKKALPKLLDRFLFPTVISGCFGVPLIAVFGLWFRSGDKTPATIADIYQIGQIVLMAAIMFALGLVLLFQYAEELRKKKDVYAKNAIA